MSCHCLVSVGPEPFLAEIVQIRVRHFSINKKLFSLFFSISFFEIKIFSITQNVEVKQNVRIENWIKLKIG